jgi:hypothetical protein
MKAKSDGRLSFMPKMDMGLLNLATLIIRSVPRGFASD